MIPLYMLRRWAMPGGSRLARLEPPVEVAGTCSTCSQAVIRKKIVGQMQTDGIYRNGEFYHYRCIPFSVWHQEKVIIPQGNLEPEEYRLWIGSKESYMSWAMCRCCRTSVYTKIDRQAHLKSERFAVDGDRCAKRLVKAYVELQARQFCLICKKQRFNHEKWGVPLCERPECELDWKFSQQDWLPLKYLLAQQVKKAGIPTLDVKPSFAVQEGQGITVYRPWCNVCSMFSDNASHTEIHAAAIVRGEVNSD